MLRTLAGYVLGATALVACPCHLPITAPLLLAVLGGTSLGSVLSTNPEVLFLAAGAYFVLALAGAAWFLGRGLSASSSRGEAKASTGETCCASASWRSKAASGERPGVASRD